VCAACPTPRLNLNSSSVPPGTTSNIRSQSGPRRIKHRFMQHLRELKSNTNCMRSQMYLLGYFGAKTALKSRTGKVKSCSGSRFCRPFKSNCTHFDLKLYPFFVPVSQFHACYQMNLPTVRSPASCVMTQTAIHPSRLILRSNHAVYTLSVCYHSMMTT
jgi:hypothetical protein